MPSVWYEEHLVVPDTIDAYGVGFVGAPFIAIGFNRDVAWTETNTAADVADYYIETVDDDAHPTKYKLDGAWKPLEVRVETVRDRAGRALATDTIYHTHRGAMLRAGRQWVSRRWTVLEPNDVNGVFENAAKAHSSAELFRAFDSYAVPAQNVLTADRGGHIAIRSTGHYPIRPKSAPRGDVLIDGSSSANDWQGWWPLADYPQAVDPPQGYLASANQQPKDPRVDPRYFGWDWPDPWRAMRINALLRADSHGHARRHAAVPDRSVQRGHEVLRRRVPACGRVVTRAARHRARRRGEAPVRMGPALRERQSCRRAVRRGARRADAAHVG